METSKDIPTSETLASSSKVGTSPHYLIPYSIALGEEI